MAKLLLFSQLITLINSSFVLKTVSI